MQKSELKNMPYEAKAAAVVVVERVPQYSRWRVTVNDAPVVIGSAFETLYSDLERVGAWVLDAGFDQFTVRAGAPDA